MYRVPENLDLTFIIGADLNMISLGRYDVQFVFDCKSTISLQSRATVLFNGSEISAWTEDGWSSLDFQKLLNQTVVGYSVPNDRVIEVQFDSGFTLQLHDDSDQYESMQIYPPKPDNTIVII